MLWSKYAVRGMPLLKVKPCMHAYASATIHKVLSYTQNVSCNQSKRTQEPSLKLIYNLFKPMINVENTHATYSEC